MFYTEIGGDQSDFVKPYLFMTVMFADKHRDDQLQTALHRVKGATVDEILYADDTICISEDEGALTRLLAAIEYEGSRYGRRLNK